MPVVSATVGVRRDPPALSAARATNAATEPGAHGGVGGRRTAVGRVALAGTPPRPGGVRRFRLDGVDSEPTSSPLTRAVPPRPRRIAAPGRAATTPGRAARLPIPATQRATTPASPSSRRT